MRPLEDIEIATWAAKDMSERSALDIFGLGPAGPAVLCIKIPAIHVATLALREQTSNHPRTDQERSSFGSIKPSTEPRHGCEANWGKEQDENLSSLGPIVDGSEIQLSGQFSIVLSGSLAKTFEEFYTCKVVRTFFHQQQQLSHIESSHVQ